MKVSIDRENLADKLKKAFRFVPSKTLVTAQGNFMCVIRDKVMEITAGDSQSQVKIYCPVKNDEDFSFCVEASLFLKTISLFRENEVRITSTLVDKKYPNSEAVFSKKGQDYAVINTLEFKDVFMRLKLYTEEKNSDKTVKMFTNPENVNELILTASSSLKPKEGSEAITIRNISGKPIKKGFNSGAMLKLLANIESNELAFFFTDDDRVSCFIDPIAEGNGENNFNFVISSCM